MLEIPGINHDRLIREYAWAIDRLSKEFGCMFTYALSDYGNTLSFCIRLPDNRATAFSVERGPFFRYLWQTPFSLNKVPDKHGELDKQTSIARDILFLLQDMSFDEAIKIVELQNQENSQKCLGETMKVRK